MSINPPTILIVDNNLTLPDMLAYTLQQEGFRVLIALDTALAVRLASSEHPDLIILDLSDAERDGVPIFQAIRREHEVPILILSTDAEAGPQIQGLDLGTTSAPAQPYPLRELLARVRAALRLPARPAALGSRNRPLPAQNDERFQIGDLIIDLAGRTVLRDGQRVGLKPREFDLLAFLVRHPDQTFSREMLIAHVWGPGYTGSLRTIDVHVRCLRAKLEQGQRPSSLIQTIFNVGYKLAPPPGAIMVETPAPQNTRDLVSMRVGT